MVDVRFVAVGALVVLTILVLSLRLNRRRRAAAFALRLAEAYRTRGDMETALALYEIPRARAQRVPEARDGAALAQRGIREPVIEPALVEGAARLVEQDVGIAQRRLAAYGVTIVLPPLRQRDGDGPEE